MTPSNSREAERSVLGSLLRDNDCIGDVVQVMRGEDFYLDAHRRIWAAAIAIWESHKPVDLVTLADYLRQHIEEIGGYAYLGELWEAAPTAANAVYYAGIVRDHAIRRELDIAAREIIRECESPTGPADAALEDAEKRIFAVAQMGVRGNAVPLEDAVLASLDRLDARETRQGVGAVLTGFADLDELTSGLQDGELILIGARPSTGKTALGLGIARNAAAAGVPVFFASLEQSRVELAERLLCSEARVDGHRVRKGMLAEDERQRLADASEFLRRLPFDIDDSPGQTVLRIAANVRRLQRRKGIKLVVVDYIQLIESEDKKATRQEQVAGISRRLKCLARECGVPVVALAQLNRGSELHEKPKLSDLRDTGALEQDADTVFLLHKPEESPGTIEVIVGKQRNGPTGEVTLTFLKQFVRFENFAPMESFPRYAGNGHYANGYH